MERRSWTIVVVLSLIGMLAALQGTILVPLVAELPHIYGVSTLASSWLITATLLAGALATPIITRLADAWGKRRLVVITLAGMLAGSLVVAVTDSFAVAVAGRAVQGLSSALIPVAMSIVKDVLPPRHVGPGVAIVSGTLGLGAAAGLPLAGLMYGVLGWHALFSTTAVLALVLVLLVLWLLPADGPRERERFDWLGAALLVVMLAPLLMVITQGSELGWLSATTVVLAGTVVVAAVLWVPIELRREHALVDLRLASRRTVLLTNVSAVAISVAMLANLLLASLQLATPAVVDGGFGLPAGQVGLLMAAPAGAVALFAPGVGSLVRRWSGRTVLVVGAAWMSLAYLGRVALDGSVVEVVVGSLLVGVGTSMCFAAMPILIMSVVPNAQTAAANGVNALCRMIGTATSTAGLAALTAMTATTVDGVQYPGTTTFHIAFYVCAGATAVAVVLAWCIPGHAASAAEGVGTPGPDPEQGLAPRARGRYIRRNKNLVRNEVDQERVELPMRSAQVIDANVGIFFRSDKDLRSYLREPFASRGYPDPDVAWFAPIGGRFAPEAIGTVEVPKDGGRFEAAPMRGDDGHPGSDPEIVGRTLFEDRKMDLAILHPKSVGAIQPDWHLGNELLAAANRMMVERWLESGTYANRFRGTIRVNPNDIDEALREIDRWKDHPQMVQIGLPLQTQAPYGRPYYKPLWRAACDAGLPIVVHEERGMGITHPPTPNGIARTYSQHVNFVAMSYLYHLMNMIAEGVFEQFPDLKVVWGDGAADMLTPIIWRMDCFGRPHLEQTPWAPRIPSDYLAGHVYFVHSRLDGPGDAPFADEWLRMTGKEDMLMFGSSYPDWTLMSPEDLPPHWSDTQREKVLWRNATDLYGLSVTAPATS